MRLDGKVAIVTGAASGFGEGIAKRFAREGARVLVSDVNVRGGGRVAGEIATDGGKALFVKSDVTRAQDWAGLVGAAQASFGKLDVVVNNAGWTHRKKPYLEVTEAEFDKVYAVNVKSVYLSVLHALPVFRKQRGGCFVNIASTAGLRPRPGLAVYNSSKAAVILLSKSLAAELGPDNVRVNCVNPVFSPETGLSAEFAGGTLSPEVRAAYLATIPLGRFSTPMDVANACVYLASDEAAYVTGQTLHVNGGMAMI